jgi:hypothetical protein
VSAFWLSAPLSLIADPLIRRFRVTRLAATGMGRCQGRRCRDQALMLLAGASRTARANILPSTYRAPVRSLLLKVIADYDEPGELRRKWPTWFHAVNEGEAG